MPNHQAATTQQPALVRAAPRRPRRRAAGSTSIRPATSGSNRGGCSGPCSAEPVAVELAVRRAARGRQRARRTSGALLRRDAPARRRRPTPALAERARSAALPARGRGGRGTPFLNYRRFFDVSDLAGVRVEDPDVFAASHALIAELWDAGIVDGLRVDHVDGLADPATYLRRLGDLVPDTFVVVEKILAADEALPPGWPVAGTTGYEAATDLTAVLIDPGRPGPTRSARCSRRRARRAFATSNARRRSWCSASCSRRSGGGCAARSTRPRPRPTIDARPDGSRDALAEITLGARVYRTYCTGEPARRERPRAASPTRSTSARAACSEPARSPRCRPLLLGDDLPTAAAAARARVLVQRWQQLTGPVMAKGHEDTADYRYPVAPRPSRGRQRSVRSGARRRRAVPRRTPRGAPTRAGPASPRRRRTTPSAARTSRPPRRAERTRRRVRGGLARWIAHARPRADHHARRARASSRRRCSAPGRSTPRRSTTSTPRLADVPGEGAARGQGGVVVARTRRGARSARRRLSPRRRSPTADACCTTRSANSSTTSPGTARSTASRSSRGSSARPARADIYRGCELWDFSLVDPDNRRPVDYGLRIALLRDRSDDWRSGAVKMHMTAAGLHARRAHPEVFTRRRVRSRSRSPTTPRSRSRARASRRGRSRAHRACAPGSRLATIGRSVATCGATARSTLPPDAPQQWRDVYTDASSKHATGTLLVGDVLTRLPAALLVSTLTV